MSTRDEDKNIFIAQCEDKVVKSTAIEWFQRFNQDECQNLRQTSLTIKQFRLLAKRCHRVIENEYIYVVINNYKKAFGQQNISILQC